MYILVKYDDQEACFYGLSDSKLTNKIPCLSACLCMTTISLVTGFVYNLLKCLGLKTPPVMITLTKHYSEIVSENASGHSALILCQ